MHPDASYLTWLKTVRIYMMILDTQPANYDGNISIVHVVVQSDEVAVALVLKIKRNLNFLTCFNLQFCFICPKRRKQFL